MANFSIHPQSALATPTKSIYKRATAHVPTDYSNTKEKYTNKNLNTKEITNKNGQTVLIHSERGLRVAEAFDKKTGKLIKTTNFAPDGTSETILKDKNGYNSFFRAKDGEYVGKMHIYPKGDKRNIINAYKALWFSAINK